MINEFKKIPNQITIIRIILIPFLYYFSYYNNRDLFAVLLVFAAFTDALDGFFARILKQESEFGKALDSFADRLIYLSLIAWFYFLERELIIENINWIILLVSFFLLSQIINILKYKKLIFRHTTLAKTTAIILFITIITGFLTTFNNYLFYSVYILAIIAMLEEIILSIKYKDPNKRFF